MRENSERTPKERRLATNSARRWAISGWGNQRERRKREREKEREREIERGVRNREKEIEGGAARTGR
jgi:hypothetical protein